MRRRKGRDPGLRKQKKNRSFFVLMTIVDNRQLFARLKHRTVKENERQVSPADGRRKLLFVRADVRRGFIEHAVDELMAVFSTEDFRQLNRFVDGHFVRHIITF